MLHKFESTHQWLDHLGFPRLKETSGFQVIKGIDFEEAYRSGSITFKGDGVYLEYEGKEYRGYMFIKEPWITQYGSYPKFHLTKCRTIQEFIQAGRFKIRYEWSNSNVNDLVDKTTRNKYEDEVLGLCHYCRQQIQDEIENTQDFFDSLDKEELEERDVEVDIMGYTRGWNLVSRKYREKKNYTCEKCGLKCKNKMHRRYWHVHHRNGDKTNANTSNLECLCVRCHSQVDARHESNFYKPRLKRELDTFLAIYGDQV